jgi:hypothetical protein
MAGTPAAERRAKALELHLAGTTYQVIAEQLGYSDRRNACKDVQKALDELAPDDPNADATVVKVARIDAMLQGLWPKARRGDVQAIDRVLKLEERRDKLTADAPAQPAGGETGGSKITKLRAIHGGKATRPAAG